MRSWDLKRFGSMRGTRGKGRTSDELMHDVEIRPGS
jgi:hypothetical protein